MKKREMVHEDEGDGAGRWGIWCMKKREMVQEDEGDGA